MHSRIVAAAVLTLPFLIGHAHAEPLPNWSISKICQSDSAPGQCRLFESRARARVAEAWLTLPESIQKGCAAEFHPPLEPSWRIMGDCIGELGVVTRVNVRRNAVEREKKVVAVLRERREKAEKEAKRKAAAVEAAKRQKLAVAAQKERLAKEEQSFLAALEEERARERRQRLAAQAAKQQAQELEDQRLAAEEASFLKELAAQQKRERLAKAAAAAKAVKEAAARAKSASGSSATTFETASASTVGPISGGQAARPPQPEKPKAQKTLKVALPAQPAQKAVARPIAKKVSAKPRTPEVAICEDRLKETAQAGSVLFAFDSAELLEEAELTLRALSAAVRACGRLKVTIEGHTDATGGTGYNQGLSERRAQNVANFLINAGAKSSQVSYVGYGEKRPVASNKTSDGRAKNRRIEYSAN